MQAPPSQWKTASRFPSGEKLKQMAVLAFGFASSATTSREDNRHKRIKCGPAPAARISAAGAKATAADGKSVPS